MTLGAVQRSPLIVLTPRVAALGASEKAGLALVSASELPQPPVGGVVATLWAVCTCRGKPSLLLLLEHGDVPRLHAAGEHHCPVLMLFLLEPTPSAPQHAARGNHDAPALGTKMHTFTATPL